MDTKTSGRLNAGSDRYGIAPDFYWLSIRTNICWDWCWDRAYLEGLTSPFIPSEQVGRPGLDPGTLGLKVPCSSG